MKTLNSSEIETLLARCRKGNSIIRDLWTRACAVTDDDAQWADLMETFHLGTLRLQHLADQLQALGYTDCLYDIPRCRGTADILCYGCPSTAAHWRENAQQERMI